MKNKIVILGVALLTLMVVSCREDSDDFLDYSHNSTLTFAKANKSFADEFQVFWNSMNQNYMIWDVEKSYGLDWDAVYKEFMPQFEALDKKDFVSDEEFYELLCKVVGPLHDGHAMMEFKNLKTGKFVAVSPNQLRASERDDYEIASNFSPNLRAYAYPTDGSESEIILADGDLCWEEASSTVNEQLYEFFNTPKQGVQYIKKTIEELSSKTLPSEYEVITLHHLLDLMKELNKMENVYVGEALEIYNNAASTYAFLKIPGFSPINDKFADNGVTVKYCLFKGNIAYFYMSGFKLSSYLDETYKNELFGSLDINSSKYVEEVKKVWNSWFNTICELQKKGSLGGVIIDLRSNGGGYQNDFKYVLGALMESGSKVEIGKSRFKTGPGRYDYSPLMPDVRTAMEDGQQGVSQPIVILTNCMSVSMSEMTSMAAQNLPNGRVIGKQTWGGTAGLVGDYADYSIVYSGHIGERNKTPFWGYIPSIAQFTKDGKSLEGVGVTPDIEVDFNTSVFQKTGRDTQLDRALQYIRTGN